MGVGSSRKMHDSTNQIPFQVQEVHKQRLESERILALDKENITGGPAAHQRMGFGGSAPGQKRQGLAKMNLLKGALALISNRLL